VIPARCRHPATSRVAVAPPDERDMKAFLRAVARSRALHAGFVAPPDSPRAYRAYLRRTRGHRHRGFLVRERASGELAGVINLNEIVRGSFRCAYLGYYAFVPAAGTGLMGEGLGAVLGRAFRQEKLHRLEANIQPHNAASLGLVRHHGFRREGFSPRYLKVGGRWRDHERWALTADEWRAQRSSR